MVPVSVLRERLDADFDTGVLTWKKRHGFAWSETQAGRLNKTGYVLVSIYYEARQRKLSAHRILWALATGDWPKQQIDHINHDRADNRLANLRDVSSSVNQANRKRVSGSRQPALGVRASPSGKFTAYVGGSGRQRHLGTFPTLDAAIAARAAASSQATNPES